MQTCSDLLRKTFTFGVGAKTRRTVCAENTNLTNNPNISLYNQLPTDSNSCQGEGQFSYLN